MRREIDMTDDEAARRANALDAEGQGPARCPYCAGSGIDQGDPTVSTEHALPETPEEIDRFLHRDFGHLRRTGARRGLHVAKAIETGFRSEGSMRYDRAELAFIRISLALLGRYAGELSAARKRG
jgi:hypothetical protein